LKENKNEKLIMICALVVLLTAFGSTAKAVPDNPANWHWSLQTDDEARDDWHSPTPVDIGYPQYCYEWQLTHEFGPWAAVEMAAQWRDAWDKILAGDKSGSGTYDGLLPFSDELILHVDYPEITADFLLSVNENGYATISIDNITFGQVHSLDVTGARFSGNVTVEGVPEPATLSFLALGSLVFLRKRRT